MRRKTESACSGVAEAGRLPELLGSNAEECLRLASETRNRVIRSELRRLADAYLSEARALMVQTAMGQAGAHLHQWPK